MGRSTDARPQPYMKLMSYGPDSGMNLVKPWGKISNIESSLAALADRIADLDQRFTNYVTIKAGILLFGLFFDCLRGWKWIQEQNLLEDIGIAIGFVTAALLSLTATLWSFGLRLSVDDVLPVSRPASDGKQLS